jgi:uncharacterized NAD-dependent epimerase/dehydratase family protein
MEGAPRERFVILAEGHLDPFAAKTATSLVRYRGGDVVAVLDREHQGRPLREVLGVESTAPVLGSLTEALALRPTTLVIGISPAGGQLPERWRPILNEAIAAGLDVVSGLHLFLTDDPDLAERAARHGVRLVDLRRPPDAQPIAHALARETSARRILTVGTDCNIGKMVTSLEITAAARREGVDARFLATGQTGILVSGSGIPVDRVIGDFMAGLVERSVLELRGSEWIVVEGQGCLLHPAYSGVTLALLHGVLPDQLILCHYPARLVMRNQTIPIPPLNDWINLYESILRPLHRGRVVGIALNTHGLADDAARAAVARAEDETGLPATDVIRYGALPLVKAIQQCGLIARVSDC